METARPPTPARQNVKYFENFWAKIEISEIWRAGVGGRAVSITFSKSMDSQFSNAVSHVFLRQLVISLARFEDTP